MSSTTTTTTFPPPPTPPHSHLHHSLHHRCVHAHSLFSMWHGATGASLLPLVRQMQTMCGPLFGVSTAGERVVALVSGVWPWGTYQMPQGDILSYPSLCDSCECYIFTLQFSCNSDHIHPIVVCTLCEK